jgi:AraC-like DNA-binding protein
MRITRTPGPVLQSVVERFWAIDPDAGVLPTAVSRERVLPTGQMHLAFRLSGGPLQLFVSDTDRAGHCVAEAIVGGARTASYLRDVSRPAQTVGAQLRPGAAEVLFGVPAHALAERHTPLDDLWPGEVEGILEQLASTVTLHQRIDRLEAIFAARLAAREPVLHPAVATALRQLPGEPAIQRIARETGYSHRALIALFRRSVGLTPGDYRRMLRFRGRSG